MTAHMASSSWFLKNNFSLVVFDYRGYGFSKGEVSRENTIEDGLQVLRYFIQKYPNQKILILGQSLGAAIAFVSITQLKQEEQNHIKAMVFDSGFASYRHLAQSKLSQFLLTWPMQFPLSFLVGDHWAPKDYAPIFKTPILFLHGEKDSVVPQKESMSLFFEINSEKFWLSVKDGGHIDAFIKDQYYRKRTLDFFNDNAGRN